MRKYFTVEEANRTLPLVERIVGDIVTTHRTLEERVEEYRSLAPDEDPERRRAMASGIEELTATVNRFIGELHELGALFKGIEEGLVDYYAMLDDRPVFLCWKLGEERIEWWHEIEAGYAGRQRLPDRLLVERAGS